MRSDSMMVAGGMVPRPRPRVAAGGGSQRDKMSKFREPSFRLLTGPRKLQGGSSNKLLDETIDAVLLESWGDTPRVRFALAKNERIMVTNFSKLVANKSELWWTAEELNASRADGRLNASTDPEVREYILSFDRAYKKVLTDKRITSDCLRDLVVGLSKGYRGLEDHALTGSKMTRQFSNFSSYASSVVKHYRDCCKKELGGDSSKTNLIQRYDRSRSICSLTRQSSVSSLMSQHSFSPSGHKASAIDQSVRNYSKKLSAGSRNFAQTMGRAEHLAVGREKNSLSGSTSFSIPRTPDERDDEEEKDETSAQETE
jgi:hypothetical protein